MQAAPNLNVNVDLYRAALHFVAKGDEATVRPATAGVHIMRSGSGGVSLIAMSHAGIILLRDPHGEIERDATIHLRRSFFDAARRASSEIGLSAAQARLDVCFGMARIQPGAGLHHPTEEITAFPFPDWRAHIPRAVARRAPPPVAPAGTEIADNAIAILANARLLATVQHLGAEDGSCEIVHFGPAGFALLPAANDDDVEPMPWRAPIWLIGAHEPEAAAS